MKVKLEGTKVQITLDLEEADKLMYACQDIGEVYEGMDSDDVSEDDSVNYVNSVGNMLFQLGSALHSAMEPLV